MINKNYLCLAIIFTSIFYSFGQTTFSISRKGFEVTPNSEKGGVKIEKIFKVPEGYILLKNEKSGNQIQKYSHDFKPGDKVDLEGIYDNNNALGPRFVQLENNLGILSIVQPDKGTIEIYIQSIEVTSLKLGTKKLIKKQSIDPKFKGYFYFDLRYSKAAKTCMVSVIRVPTNKSLSVEGVRENFSFTVNTDFEVLRHYENFWKSHSKYILKPLISSQGGFFYVKDSTEVWSLKDKDQKLFDMLSLGGDSLVLGKNNVVEVLGDDCFISGNYEKGQNEFGVFLFKYNLKDNKVEYLRTSKLDAKHYSSTSRGEGFNNKNNRIKDLKVNKILFNQNQVFVISNIRKRLYENYVQSGINGSPSTIATRGYDVISDMFVTEFEKAQGVSKSYFAPIKTFNSPQGARDFIYFLEKEKLRILHWETKPVKKPPYLHLLDDNSLSLRCLEVQDGDIYEYNTSNNGVSIKKIFDGFTYSNLEEIQVENAFFSYMFKESYEELMSVETKRGKSASIIRISLKH